MSRTPNHHREVYEVKVFYREVYTDSQWKTVSRLWTANVEMHISKGGGGTFFCFEEICHFECFQNVNKKTISGPGHLETSWRTSSGVGVRMEPIQRSLHCAICYWWSSLCGGTRRRRAYFNQWAEHQPGQVWRCNWRLHTPFEAGEKHDGTNDVYFWTR